MRIALKVRTAFEWIRNSIDIIAAFLEGDKIFRNVFVQPPKEFFCGKIWKLDKTLWIEL